MRAQGSGEGPARGEWLYRIVLRLHPRRFLRTFGDEMVSCFRQTWHQQVEGRGLGAELSFWVRMVSGALSTAWEQHTIGRAEGARGWRIAQWFQVRNDVKIGVRTLTRNPLWTLMVVLTLGVGMGPTTAVFTITQAVLLAPLPYEDGERLVRIYGRRADLGSFDPMFLAAPATAELRDETASFERVVVLENYSAKGVDLTGGDRNERVRVLRVSSDYFGLVGARPVLGRTFAPSDERADARVAVITERVWRAHLGGEAGAVGRSIVLDGEAYTVVAVVSDAVRDPLEDEIDVWLPARLAEAATRSWDNNYLSVVAMLADGVTLDRARSELTVLEQRHAAYGSDAAEKGYLIVPLKEDVAGSARPLLLVVIGAAVFLLLLTCTNVASLLLSKAATRESEFAVRKALGSGSLHLARQALVETGILALAGGAVGLLAAALSMEGLLAIAPFELTTGQRLGVGFPTAAFAGLLALAVGGCLGIATSVPYVRPRLQVVLAQRRGRGTGGTTRARNLLVVADVALSVVLLVGAGVLLRTMDALQNRDLGVEPEGVWVFDLNMPNARYGDGDERISLQRDIHTRLTAIPGVVAAGSTSHLPATGPRNTWGTRRAHAVGEPFDTDNIQVNQRIVDGAFFDVMGLGLLAGRVLEGRDDPVSPHVVVINQALVRALFSDEEPVGRRIRVGPTYPEIVGVVEDVPLTPRAAAAPTVYHAFAQFGAERRWSNVQVLSIAPSAAEPWSRIRSEIAAIDGELIVHRPRTLEGEISAGIGSERFASRLVQAFALISLSLAAFGLYGVLAYAVERRRWEIGVRMALGARNAGLRRMVVGRGLKLTVLGVAVGLALSTGLVRGIDFLLFGVEPLDPGVFATVPVLILGVALLASWVPSMAATRVNAAESLMGE